MDIDILSQLLKDTKGGTAMQFYYTWNDQIPALIELAKAVKNYRDEDVPIGSKEEQKLINRIFLYLNIVENS